MASILVIGVGSTGLSIMERAQQYYYEFTKNSNPSNAAFMYLETDVKRKPTPAPNGKTAIQPCYLDPQNINATLTNWHENGKYDWMPKTADVLNAHAGAGGQPAYGRVALWEGATNVQNMIQNLYGSIGGNAGTNIYIVGSLTGGTGTGAFLDVAYMVRNFTGNTNVYGIFLLPNKSNVGNSSMMPLYQNAYSSLRSLDSVSKTKGTSNYKCVLPSGIKLSSLSAPFYNVQFLTEDFADATASLSTLSQLIQTAGFNLVLRMLDVNNANAPFQDLIKRRLVDYTQHVPDGIFTTIGINVFQYPETLLEEYLTTSLIEESLLNRWADKVNYLDQHGAQHAIATLETQLKIDAIRFVHERIKEAIGKSKGSAMMGKSTFQAALDSEINKICSGDSKFHQTNYISSLFDANNGEPNFYAAIKGQETQLRDELIRSITSKVQSISTSYQNLQVVEIFIRQVISALEKIVDSWERRYKVDGTQGQWNKCWEDLYDNRLAHGEWLYAALVCRKNWYSEAFEGVADICYFNSFINGINDVVNAMKQQQAPALPVPSLYAVQEIQKKVAYLLDGQKKDSVVARKNNIAGQLNNNNPQIILLFNNLTYQDDVASAMGKYRTGSNRLTFSTISSDSMWDFLSKRTESEIKSVLISQGLAFVQSLSLFAGADIDVIMRNLPNTHPAYNKVDHILNGMPANIQQDVPAMSQLVDTEQFINHHCLKLIATTHKTHTDATGLFQNTQHFRPNPQNDDYLQLPSMKNTVVIYQEYAYLGAGKGGSPRTFNPLIHLSYQQQVLDAIKNDDSFDDSVRLAYIDKNTLLDVTNVKIK